MERRLIESEERLRLAMDGAQIGTFDWDIPTGWVQWSSNLCELFGEVPTSNGLIRFEDFQKLVHPDDAATVRRALEDAFANGRYRCEFRMVLPDGRWRWVDTRGTVNFDEQGRPLRLVGVDIEITAHKQMEQQLIESLALARDAESRARARGDELGVILDNVPALTFIAHDPECRRMTSSHAAHKVLRIPFGGNTSKTAQEGERPQNFRVLRNGVEVPGEDLPVQMAARTGREVRNAELTLLFDDGTRRQIYGHAAPLFDATGNSRGAVGAFIDITEQRRAEKALQTQEELLRKTERLAAAGQLASSLAHEINNPLEAVTNILYLLENHHELPGPEKALVSAGVSEVERISRIVAQSLSYYRTDRTPTRVSLGELVQESVSIFGGKFAHARIVLNGDISADTEITGFVSELRQMIDNLLLNALEAMPEGGTLRISVRPSCDPRDHDRRGARLTIADSGCGISRQHLSRIFQPFFTTKADKGTGLGMWVVHGLAAKHEGRIQLRSSQEGPRQGTTVSLFFPAHTRDWHTES